MSNAMDNYLIRNGYADVSERQLLERADFVGALLEKKDEDIQRLTTALKDIRPQIDADPYLVEIIDTTLLMIGESEA